jgi:uncharacterized LabA/DUF88 family protein
MINSKNGQTEKVTPSQDVAVYLDFENLYVSLKTTVKMDPNFDVLMEKCREFGRVTVARAYADWSEFTRILTSQMFANGFEPVYVPTRKFYDAKTRGEARKNSVDIHITIDIVKSLFLHENVDVFILISGDRDYVPLINQIRQHGKSVYAIGVAGCTSSELSVAVDDMFFYHQLLEDGTEPEQAVDVYNKLMQAIRMARQRGYPTTLGILKPIMKELIEGFDERKYKNARGAPFQKFKDLVLEAQNRHMVRLVTTGAVSEVFLWAEEPSKIALTRPEPPSSGRRVDGRAPRERGGRPPRERGERGGERRPAASPPAGTDASDAAETAAAGDPAGLAPEDLIPAGLEGESADRATAGAEPEESRSPRRASAPVEAEPAPEERLTGIGLDSASWDLLRQAVDSFGSKPPSPRKLLVVLKQWSGEGRFGEPTPTDADMQELLRQAVETGKLERLRKGFSTIYRLPEPAAAV